MLAPLSSQPLPLRRALRSPRAVHSDEVKENSGNSVDPGKFRLTLGVKIKLQKSNQMVGTKTYCSKYFDRKREDNDSVHDIFIYFLQCCVIDDRICSALLLDETEAMQIESEFRYFFIL